MNDSMEDFEIPKKRKALAEITLNRDNVISENKSRSSSGSKSKQKDASVQCCSKMKEMSTQCGFENSVSYASKLESADGDKHINFKTLLMELIPNKESTINFCFKMGIIPDSKQCPTCGNSMSLIYDSKVSDQRRWYCRQRQGPNKHEHRLSIRNGTFFSKSNLTLEEILQFFYLWVNGTSQDQIHHEIGTSGKTDVDFASFCREVCETSIMNRSEQIGGKDIVVEIDESKFAKRKYNIGHRVVGGWVFGGRETENKKKVFMVAVEDRTAETLLAVIQKWIAPGSIIWSDCWKSYNKIPELPQGYRHQTVNHSKNFVDPQTGTCTNRIECDWRHAKAEFPRYGTKPEHYFGYLSVFMWKRKHDGDDKFIAFLRDVAAIDYSQ